MFNGKDFNGWSFPFGNETDWSVQNGIVRGVASTDNSTIATERDDYSDFCLRMEIRSPDQLNKHFVFRETGTLDDEFNYRFQSGGACYTGETVVIGSYSIKRGGRFRDGKQLDKEGLRETTAPHLSPMTKDAWHVVEIIARGNAFRMIVDGGNVSAFEDTQSRLERGRIDLRLRKGSCLEVRKLEIAEFGTDPPGGSSGLPTSVDDSPAQAPVGKSPVPPARRGKTPSGGTDDSFVSGIIWVGELVNELGGGRESRFPVNIEILERNGASFKARFEIEGREGAHHVREVRGKIDEGKVNWFAKDVTVITGHAGHDTSGWIRGDTLFLSYVGVIPDGVNQGQTVRGTIKMTRQANKL